MRTLACSLLFLLGLAGCGAEPEAAETPQMEADHLVYFGTYTRGGASEGIYVSRFASDAGKLTEPALAAEIEDPSYLELSPDGKFLYAVSETGEGTVSAFSIDLTTGALTLLNTVPADGGLPCDLETDSDGKMLVVANYGTGSVISYEILEDGSLSERRSFHELEGSGPHERQKSPHAHSVDFSDDSRFVVVADLGSDKLRVYETNVSTGQITPHAEVSAPAGSGPRHFAFHPKEDFAYSINELGSTVSLYSFDGSAGELELQETFSTLPESFEGKNTTAEIAMHPSGDFLYGSNRGHDSIAVFRVDRESGSLSLVENEPTQGETPRNFAIDPTGRYLLAANQNTNNVVVFEIDGETGALEATGDSLEIGAPVCIRFLPLD